MDKQQYSVANVKGDKVKLVDPLSEISLEVTEAVKSVIVQHIHTNLDVVNCAIPKYECLISPVVSFHIHDGGLGEVGALKFIATIPHCLQRKNHDFSLVKVRCGNIFNSKSMKEIPRGDPETSQIPCYKIEEKYITLYTNKFSDTACTSEEQICHKSLVILPFGSLSHDEHEKNTFAKVKVCLGSYLYNLPENSLVGTLFI